MTPPDTMLNLIVLGGGVCVPEETHTHRGGGLMGMGRWWRWWWRRGAAELP